MQSNDGKPWKPYLSKNDVEWLAGFSQAQSTSTVEEMLDDGETLLCTLYSEIAGKQYNEGKVGHLEKVTLLREPFNHFDPNAIIVQNKDKIKVGYIERMKAKPLAEIMDKQLARIEATVQQDIIIPGVNLKIWCKLKNYHYVLFIIRRHSLHVNEDSVDVDRLFESLPEGDKTSMAEAAPAVKTALYPHQKQALHWMISRENDNILPPFWEEQSNGTYYNTVDKSTVKKRPKSIKGGLLADDMGLGKTLMMIALILTNSADKKPLVEPKSSSQMLPVQIKKENLLDFAQYVGNLKMVNNLSDVDPHPSTSKTNEDCEVIVISDSDEEDEKDTDKNEQDDVHRTTKTFSLTAKSNRKRRLFRITDSDDTDDDTSRKKHHFQNSSARGKGKKKRVWRNLFPEKSESKRYSEDSDDLPSASNSPISNQICDSDSCIKNDDLPSLEPVNDSDELLSNEEDAVTCSEVEDEFDSLRANATLIVCPLSVMDIWKMQIEEHVHPHVYLNVYTYRGSKRSSEVLANQDIVITTYDMVASDFKRRSQKTHTILDVPWLRVILDEGHLIRNSSTNRAKAVKELKAERKWILTGTPIQNSIYDLESLLSFLNIPLLIDSVLWRDVIAIPIERGCTSALKHVQHLLANIAIRRTKNQKVDGKPLVQLPNKTEITERIKFSEEERNIYDRIFTEGREMIRHHFEDNTVLSSYTDIFYVLLRLRQMCCHIWLNDQLKHLTQDGPNDSEDEKTRRKAIAILKSGSDEECSICLDRINSPVVTRCAHIFCRKCIQDVIDKQKPNATCPLCRKDLSQKDLIEVNLDDDETPFAIPDNWKSSAKIDALMKSLIKLREEDVKIKSVVVTQFTKFLDLIEIPLRHNGFKFERLDGKMKPAARTKAIQTFMDESPDSPTIFLLSLKSGGLGLNLIAASRMFVMEPAWNPAAENQCCDRIYRLGQKKDVIITKFIIEDSIEESMCALQEKKRELMKGIFKTKSDKERRSVKTEFIRSCFNL